MEAFFLKTRFLKAISAKSSFSVTIAPSHANDEIFIINSEDFKFYRHKLDLDFLKIEKDGYSIVNVKEDDDFILLLS